MNEFAFKLAIGLQLIAESSLSLQAYSLCKVLVQIVVATGIRSALAVDIVLKICCNFIVGTSKRSACGDPRGHSL